MRAALQSLPFALAALVAGCVAVPIPPTEVPADPHLANAPPRPPSFEDRGWSGGSTMYYPPVNTDPAIMAGTRLGIPGIADPLATIRDAPPERRRVIAAEVETLVRQVEGAATVARNTLPKPGMEAAHAAALQKLDVAMRQLVLERESLNNQPVVPPMSWYDRKERFREAWEAVERSYAETRAAGN